jgi:serine/threonine protein kinase
MWSIGCVTVVLLTGISAFADRRMQFFCPQLARKGDLRPLIDSQQWQKVRERPQDFILRLLVFDEGQRMTAEQALDHEWFSNECHKKDFQELYQRTIKGWQPRPPSKHLFHFLANSGAQAYAHSHGILERRRRNSSAPRPADIVEAHCQPPPRAMDKLLYPWATKRARSFSASKIGINTPQVSELGNDQRSLLFGKIQGKTTSRCAAGSPKLLSGRSASSSPPNTFAIRSREPSVSILQPLDGNARPVAQEWVSRLSVMEKSGDYATNLELRRKSSFYPGPSRTSLRRRTQSTYRMLPLPEKSTPRRTGSLYDLDENDSPTSRTSSQHVQAARWDRRVDLNTPHHLSAGKHDDMADENSESG